MIKLQSHRAVAATLAALSPDGSKLLTASEDSGPTLWDAATGDEMISWKHQLPGSNSAVFSPDGTRILVACVDGTARVLNVADGESILTVADKAEDPYTKTSFANAIYSPDGLRILTAAPNPYHQHRCVIWDAQTGKRLYVMAGSIAGANGASFSPDGRTLGVITDKGHANICDPETGEIFFKLDGHGGSITLLRFSPNGKRILTCGGESTMVWDASDGNKISWFYIPDDNEPVRFQAAAFFPDSSRIVTGNSFNGINVWDTETGTKLLERLGDPNPKYGGEFDSANDVGCSPDGSLFLAAGSGLTVPVWDSRVGKKLFTLTGHQKAVRRASFSPDGKRILSISDDGTVCLSDIEDLYTKQEPSYKIVSPEFKLTGHKKHVRSVAYSPDGSRILTAGVDGTARLWNAVDGAEIYVISENGETVEQASYSPDGARILTASWDEIARVYDASDGRLQFTISGPKKDNITAAFSPDNNCIVTGGQLWDSFTGQLRATLSQYLNPVNAGCFMPDGALVILGTPDNTAIAWDTRHGRAMFTLAGHTRPVIRTGCASDNVTIYTTSWDETCRLYDCQGGNDICTLTGPDDFVWAEFSPDCKRILTGCVKNNADMWDVKTGEKLFTVYGDINPMSEYGRGIVTWVAFSPNGKLFLACGYSPTVPIFDAQTGEKLFSLDGHIDDVTKAIFSPDSTHVLTASKDGVACVWDLQNV